MAGGKALHRSGRSAQTSLATLVQITGSDADGIALARPVMWEGRKPMIFMAPEPRGQPALAPGQQVMAQLHPIGPGKFEGRTVKRLGQEGGGIVGVFRAGGRIEPADRRARAEWLVPPGETNGARPDDIVTAVPLPDTGHGLKPARIVSVLGNSADPRCISLICLIMQGIPHVFPPDVLAEAAACAQVEMGGREDLRAVGLITIDGEDARDFDDAVFAEPDGDGFRLLVAIADVAHFVPAGSALDREARHRGNSVYFADRVVPMLPEALSNGWCSLRPGEDRGCLFVEIRIGPDGAKRSHRFGRGLMRSAARMTYEQVQAAQESGAAGERIAALYAAYHALLSARRARGTLDLDLPERRVILDSKGAVRDVVPRARLASHQLIEEFMVAANVAAAEELERLRQPCMYRVHAPPPPEKMKALRSFLSGLGISFAPAKDVHPRDFDRLLSRVAGSDQAGLVNDMILRAQSPAEYAVKNTGHFGLGLSRYAHFTSPIRRYADLLVHRALITGLKLGDDGLRPAEAGGMAVTAAHITVTERRAAIAERDSVDRYLAAYLRERVGETFAASVSGVTRAGLFVTLVGSGASGLVPIASLGEDFWAHDEASQSLTGRRTGEMLRLGQKVTVRLATANPLTGGMVFHLLRDESRSAAGQRKSGRWRHSS
jgi:ribonuclease R